MKWFNAIRELLWAIIGLILLILGIALKLEWYYILIALGLMAWGIYDFVKEIKDKDVEKSEKDRKDIEGDL